MKWNHTPLSIKQNFDKLSICRLNQKDWNPYPASQEKSRRLNDQKYFRLPKIHTSLEIAQKTQAKTIYITTQNYWKTKSKDLSALTMLRVILCSQWRIVKSGSQPIKHYSGIVGHGITTTSNFGKTIQNIYTIIPYT